MKGHEIEQVEGPLPSLDDGQLAERISRRLDTMDPQHQRFAEAHVEGATKPAAARAAGFSDRGGAPWRIAARPDVVELEALLREQARRRAVVTVEGQIVRFQHLARVAEEAGEVNAAIAAEREVGRLANLYPDPKLTVQHELVDHREVTPAEIEALSLLRHGVRRQLPGPVIEAEVTRIDDSPVTPPAQVLDIASRALGADGKEAPDAP